MHKYPNICFSIHWNEWFFFSLGICLVTKWIAFVILGLAWFYDFFQTIVREPDRVKSRRKLNRYERLKKCKMIEAYSRKYRIYTTFQLFEHLDNGYSIFLHLLGNSFQPHEDYIGSYLFRIQSQFYPTLPTDGPIFLITAGIFCTMLYALLRTLDAFYIILKLFAALPSRFSVWVLSVFTYFHEKRKQTFLKTWRIFKRLPLLPHPAYVLYSDQEAISKCFELENSTRATLINFFSSNIQTVYVDNCANCHISNTRSHFISYWKYEDYELEKVNTIGGGAHAVGEGVVPWSWKKRQQSNQHVWFTTLQTLPGLTG